MKQAEEWMKQLGGHDSTGEHPPIVTVNRQIIREIQLNAYKAGMSEAADLIYQTFDGSSCDRIKAQEVIISARDRKTSL